MIPPVVIYVLGALLGVWGAFRLNLARRPGAKGRSGHLFFGVLYLLMAAYLILTTARVIPPPRIFGGPPPAPKAQAVQVIPLSKIPVRPMPATAPGSAPASAPAPLNVQR
ncbi:MAG: hypothetical protein HY906_24500 [Deltaproteobacteria bacterium]|nr:hypothetical protein [Deltaproteobacteria bacterium]